METKPIKVNISNSYKPIDFASLQEKVSTDSLRDLLKTNSSIPTHTPKTFKDQLWLYFDGSTTYELYIFINNEWKKITLT